MGFKNSCSPWRKHNGRATPPLPERDGNPLGIAARPLESNVQTARLQAQVWMQGQQPQDSAHHSHCMPSLRGCSDPALLTCTVSTWLPTPPSRLWTLVQKPKRICPLWCWWLRSSKSNLDPSLAIVYDSGCFIFSPLISFRPTFFWYVFNPMAQNVFYKPMQILSEVKQGKYIK